MSSPVAAPPALPVPSEDILSAKTDLALSNLLVKTAIGFGAGVVTSAILFRRRPWPVLLGLGFGLGQGYSDAERVFNPAAIPGFVIASEATPAPSPYAAFNPFGKSAPSSPTEVKAAVVSKAKDVKEAIVGKAAEMEKKVEAKVEAKKEEKKLV